MRRRPPDRLEQIIAAALRVFGEKGYQRTQMADVARAMGASPGTLYNYVTGKEALFHLVVDRAFVAGAASDTPKLPIPAPSPGGTVQRLRERLAAEAALPALEAALARARVADPRAELQGIVRELYALIERTRLGIVTIERSALDLPELARVFYDETCRDLVERLTRFLVARIAGRQLRPLPHPAAAARLILENVAMFAMHRHRAPGDAALIDDVAARETVVDLLVHALAIDHGRAIRSTRTQRRR